LQRDIENIVHEHSGGIKLTALVTELIKQKHHRVCGIEEEIMQAIHTNENLMILDYTWRSNNRVKSFVYTP
jgi:hypothetical protein